MMVGEDDDLPVLTDVLRARAPILREALDPRRVPPGATSPSPAAEKAGASNEEPQDEELVIGTEPEASPPAPIATELFGNATEIDACTGPDPSTQPHPQAEGVVAEPHREAFDEEDEAFLESFDGIATPEDQDAIEHLSEDPSVTGQLATAPVAFDADAMALRVHDAVLEDLAQRIDTELDARLAQSVTAQLESALAGLQSGLRASLADALRDVVRRAVDDEIARVRDSRDI